MNEPRTAVILVGGMGMRLRSVVADRPKVLAAVHGKPFLVYLLDQVAAAGITRTILCVGYRAEQIQTAFGEMYAGMSLVYSQEISPLGTGGALRLALPLVESETFITMNGDSFCDVNLNDLWEWHKSRLASMTMVLTSEPDTARYGRVSLGVNWEIVGFEEKGSAAGAGWINAGIYVCNSEMVHSIPVGCAISLEHDIFPNWVGHQLYGYPSQGRFLDIGTPEAYAQVDALFDSDRK